MARQREAMVGVDDHAVGCVQGLLGDMVQMHPAELPTINAAQGASKLAGADLTAIAEGRQHVAPRGLLELGRVAGDWPKAACPLEPDVRIDQYIEDPHVADALWE